MVKKKTCFSAFSGTKRLQTPPWVKDTSCGLSYHESWLKNSQKSCAETQNLTGYPAKSYPLHLYPKLCTPSNLEQYHLELFII